MLANIFLLTLSILGVIVLLIFVSILLRNREGIKPILFGAIVLVALGYTVFLAGSTLMRNITSETKGPVHWHADFEIWKCGQKITLKSPEGLSNRIGTPLLHEHGDKRIHVEGAVDDLKNISLGNFFEVIGGKLTSQELTVPTDYGFEHLKNGECNGQEAFFQVYKFSPNNSLIEQEKLDNPAEYIIAKQTQVPPGDCLIFEMDEFKPRTDHICQSYQVAKEKGILYGR